MAARPGVDPRLRDGASLFGTDELQPGAELGPFVVTRKLGESALCIVYVARREGEDHVLKVLRRAASRDQRAVQRFLTAQRMLAEVHHPGLPHKLDVGEGDGAYWVSHLTFDGSLLSTRFARTGPSHFTELRPILRGILEPLAALHKARIAHGSLKLENVVVGRPQLEGDDVTSPGEAPRGAAVLLVDAGMDRLRQRTIGHNGHGVGVAVFASPKTIAPEQVRGQRAEPATDVYAFGAVMYELLSGRPVFAYETATGRRARPPRQGPRAAEHQGAARRWVTRRRRSVRPERSSAKRRTEGRATRRRCSTRSSRSGAAPVASRAEHVDFPEEQLTGLLDLLRAAPDDSETAIALEKAVEEGADARRASPRRSRPRPARRDPRRSGTTTASDATAIEVKKALLSPRRYGSSTRSSRTRAVPRRCTRPSSPSIRKTRSRS